MSNYNATSVKMLVNALDDVVMIKFKQGWFTLIKYEYQVGELKNSKPRDELLEFIKAVKEQKEKGEGDYAQLTKPETWISKSNIKIDNKFLKEAQTVQQNQTTDKKSLSNPESAYLGSSVTPPKGNFSTGRPTSQSKVAQKRARQQAAMRGEGSAGGGLGAKRPGLALPSFKKNLKLKLGGDAIDKDDLEDKPITGDQNPSQNPQTAAKDQPSAPLDPKPIANIPDSATLAPSWNPTSSAKPVYEDTDFSEKQPEIQQMRLDLERTSPKKLMIDSEISQNEPLRNPVSSKDQNLQLKQEKLTLVNNAQDKQIESQQTQADQKTPNESIINQDQSTNNVVHDSIIQFKQSEQKIREDQFALLFSQISQRPFYKTIFPKKMQCTLFEKRFFDRYKEFVRVSRREEFILRIQLIEYRNQRTKPLRKSFDKMKVNSLAREVQAYTQDKFQYYLKYVRKLCNILNTSGLTSPQINFQKKRAFHHWRAQTYFLQTLEEKSYHLRELNEGCEDPNLIQEAQTHLIDSVYLHKESINWLQNDNVVYLKELKMQNFTSPNIVDTSTRQFIAALNNTSLQSNSLQTQIQQQPTISKLAENKAKFYALLFSKIESVQKTNLVMGFDRIWAEGMGGDTSLASIDNSLYRLQKIRRHIIYLRKVKTSVESRYSSTRLVQPLITTTTVMAGTSTNQNHQTGSILQTNQSQVGPGTTSASAKDKQHYYSMMKIQIETPGQPQSKVGPLKLPIDPQLSVDSRKSFNAAFENSVNNRQGATPVMPPHPFGMSSQLQPTITQSVGNQAQPARTPNGPWEGSLIVPTIEDHHSQGTATDQLTPVAIETTTSNLTPVQAPNPSHHLATNPLALTTAPGPYPQTTTSSQPPLSSLAATATASLPADRDAIFLHHIERQLSENIGLVKLYRSLKVSKKTEWNCRSDQLDPQNPDTQTYEQYASTTSIDQNEIVEAVEKNRSRVKAVQKMAAVRLRLETFQKKLPESTKNPQTSKQNGLIIQEYEVEDITESDIAQNGNGQELREQQATQNMAAREATTNNYHLQSDLTSLASAFSTWQHLSQTHELHRSSQLIAQQRNQQYKSAVQTFNQYFNANTGCVEQAFDKWKNTIILKKVTGGGGSSSLVQPQSLNIGRQFITPARPGHSLEHSDHFQSPSMMIQDHRVYQKLHSFMLIKQLMLKLYIERGTVLQKYIGMLKYLAREQHRLHQASIQAQQNRTNVASGRSQRSRRRPDGAGSTVTSGPAGSTVSAAALHRKYQQEAALIEDNVSKLMRCIFRIVFNKWTLFTYHQLSNVQKPRLNATTDLFSALNRLINRRKLVGISQLHLYSLYIKEITQSNDYYDDDSNPDYALNMTHMALLKRRVPSISLDQKLKRSRVSLKLCEGLLQRWRFKSLQRTFSQWKSNCAVIEWRLNQGLLEGNSRPNEQTSEQIQILLKEPGLIDSQHLQKILEDLRAEQKESSSQLKSSQGQPVSHMLGTQIQSKGEQVIDEKAVIRQMLTDFQNARGSEGVKQFYQNYYTPKSAALKQQQQKPWEIKMQREAMKQIAIYRGATRSESMLTSASMPTEKDTTLKPIINASFDRLALLRALRLWHKILKEPVGRPEIRAMKRLFEKIRRRRLSKGFLIWKHSEIAQDTYTLQSELMDQRTIETLSHVGKNLNQQLARIKEQYKDQVRIRVVHRIFNFMKSTNPVLESFNLWKQETLELLTQKYAIRQTIADKEELRQQYELLNERNKQIVDEHIKVIQNSCYTKSGQACYDCADIQIAKLQKLTELNMNKSNYRELLRLVGPKGMRRLLGQTHHALQDISQLSPVSSGFGSSSDGDGESHLNSATSFHSSVMKFAGDKHLERAGGGKINLYQRNKRNEQEQQQVSSMHRNPKSHDPSSQSPFAPPSSQQVTQESWRVQPRSGQQSTRADALAQAIEQENQKLLQKSDKVKMQLQEKQQYIESERRKYEARIEEMRKVRDRLMDQYEAKISLKK